MSILLEAPAGATDWAAARALIEEYAGSLGVDLRFQGLERELGALPDEYGPPGGAFLIARDAGQALGCVGLRRRDAGGGELKRLYVVPHARGRGIGQKLAAAMIGRARTLGYARLYLDTLASMTAARALYDSLGFRPVAPYRFNPLPGASYFALELEGVPDAQG